MIDIIEPETSRLKLRQWEMNDQPVFAEINADPVVMKYFPNTLTENESNEMSNKIQSLLSEHGWGFWAVEIKKERKFIGFVGLHKPIAKLPFSPCTEVGWRLAKKYWGKGYATEAANIALKVAFEQLNLDKIYSFTSVGNSKSIAVMKRLYMVDSKLNFMHPSIPDSHDLQEHVLYSITQQHWRRYST